MQHPIIASSNAKLLYDELVQKADRYRQIKGLPKTPSIFTRIFVWTTGMSKPRSNEAVRSATSKTTA